MADIIIESDEWWYDNNKLYQLELMAAFIEAVKKIVSLTTNTTLAKLDQLPDEQRLGRLVGWRFSDMSGILFLDQKKLAYMGPPPGIHRWIASGAGAIELRIKLIK